MFVDNLMVNECVEPCHEDCGSCIGFSFEINDCYSCIAEDNRELDLTEGRTDE